MQPCIKISPFYTSDADEDTASPSLDYTEADSDRKGDLATAGPRGLCFFMYNTPVHADFVMDV